MMWKRPHTLSNVLNIALVAETPVGMSATAYNFDA